MLALSISALFVGDVHAAPSKSTQREHIQTAIENGREEQAITLLETYLTKYGDDGVMHYNTACMHARLNNLEQAEKHLRMAIKNNYMRFSAMQRDPDLKPIRDGLVLPSILAARDAADGILAARRNDHWMTKLSSQPYQMTRDVERKIDVISMYDEASTKKVMQRIGAVADTLTEFFGEPLRNRITIIVLQETEAKALFGSEKIRGNYRHEMRELVVTNVDRSLQHELAHAFHHSHMDAIGQEHPMWVQEGLATLFEAYEVAETGELSFVPNDRHVTMEYLLEQGREPITVEELMHCSAEGFRRDAAYRYPMARSIFEYVAERVSLKVWYKQYTKHFDDDPQGKMLLAALFDEPLAAIEARWKDWVVTRDVARSFDDNSLMQLTMRESTVGVKHAITSDDFANETESNATIVVNVEVSKAAQLYEEVRPLVLAGDYEKALPTLREIIELKPDHADARYDLALGSIVAGNRDDAQQQYEQLLKLDKSLATLVQMCLQSNAQKNSGTLQSGKLFHAQ